MSRLKGKMEKLVNLELLITIDILKLNSLHYGYWENKAQADITLKDVRIAQSKYTATLIDFIPENVHTILDVGCGVGDISKALAKKGYHVTAISPHQNHKKLFESSDNVEYLCVKFEELDLNRKFDLILMSESQNYFDVDIGFKQSKRYLNNGGYLLISGIFRKNDTTEFRHIPCIENDYIRMAQNFNLTLVKSNDITQNTLPTLEFAYEKYKEYAVPSFTVVNEFLTNLSPFKLKLLKFIFSKQFSHIEKWNGYYEKRFDPKLSEKYLKYLRLLFHYQ